MARLKLISRYRVMSRIDMKHTLHRVSQSRVNWCLAIQSSDLMKSGEKRQPKPVRQIMGRSKNKARRGQKEKKKKKKVGAQFRKSGSWGSHSLFDDYPVATRDNSHRAMLGDLSLIPSRLTSLAVSPHQVNRK